MKSLSPHSTNSAGFYLLSSSESTENYGSYGARMGLFKAKGSKIEGPQIALLKEESQKRNSPTLKSKAPKPADKEINLFVTGMV